MALLLCSSTFAAPLKIAYSDWPGWVAWDIAVQKGWIKAAGVQVEFVWFDYAASLDAFAAGKVDAVMMTNGDALSLGAKGAKSVIVMLTDYSNGNDMIVARPGILSVADLKGKKIGLELGVVEHLLLLHALKKSGLTESDVTLVNLPTADTPAALKSGRVDAVAAWQPSSGEALKALPGAKAIYTSANEPGLIYDVMALAPVSLAARRSDWKKLISVWDQVVAYVTEPSTQPDAIRIMAARTKSNPAEYAAFMEGTRFLSLAEGARIIANPGNGFGSLRGSTRVADEFNVKNGVYAQSQKVTSYIEPQLTAEILARIF